MKNQFLSKSPFFGKAAFIFIVLLFSATYSNAQGTTFAQFTQRPINEQTLRDFLFDNNTSNGAFRTTIGGSPIRFEYQNIGGLPAELSGQQDARIFINCTTTAPVFTTIGTMRLQQPINQVCDIRILRDAPTSVGVGGGARTNLLSAVITTSVTSPVLAGEDGGSAAAFTASTPDQNIFYSSDFLFFANAGGDSRNLSIALSAVTPGLSIGPGGFLNSFSANGAGTFAASTTPSYFPPTSAGATISGRVLSRKGTGVANVRVSLTDLSGETVTATTNSLGFYSFTNIAAGQTVVLSVRSKRENYATQTLTVSEDAVGFNFVPQ